MPRNGKGVRLYYLLIVGTLLALVVVLVGLYQRSRPDIRFHENFGNRVSVSRYSQTEARERVWEMEQEIAELFQKETVSREEFEGFLSRQATYENMTPIPADTRWGNPMF